MTSRRKTVKMRARKNAAREAAKRSPEFKAWLASSSLYVGGGVRSDGRDSVRDRKPGTLG